MRRSDEESVLAGRFPEFVGGEICLDFANTIGPRRPRPGTAHHDYAPNYHGVLDWARARGVVSAPGRHELAARARSNPASARVVCQDAHRLREAIYECFEAVACGSAPSSTALDAIQEQYIQALRSGRLRSTSTGAEWSWPKDHDLDAVLWPIAWSAVELLVSARAQRVKQCPGDDGQCGWLFVDTSKNASRRWCSMRTCGNQIKSRAQAARRRTARSLHH